MGTWISHLRVAEILLEKIPNLDKAAFTCGSLSPDSGIPNADWSAFDPPKEVTHFLDKGQDEGKIKDLDFYRTYLADVPLHDPHYSFLLGYFLHLIYDNLWAIRIWESSKVAFADLIAEKGTEAQWILKKDWYGLDFLYLRENPDSLFWRVFLDAPNPPVPLPYLPDQAVHQQLDYIRKFYREPRADLVLDRPYPYLNSATMNRIVEESAALLLRIYECLQAGAEVQPYHTALHLLPDFEFVGYPAPLGDPVPVAHLKSLT